MDQTIPKHSGGSYTDEQFFNHEMETGVRYENIGYRNLMSNCAKKIIEVTGSSSFLEIGFGTGVLLKELSTQSIITHGIDPMKVHYSYVKKLFPDLATSIYQVGIEDFYPTQAYDCIVSVEVFEHIEDDLLIPNLKRITDYCKYFVFTSTPHIDPEFDEQWGHVNIKSKEEWVSIFEYCGMSYERDFPYPVDWGLLFVNDE